MYKKDVIDKFISYIKALDRISDKSTLAAAVKTEFNLTIDRKVYYCEEFAVRFSHAKGINFSNTVLSLSALQKYDNRPFFVCIVTPEKNIPLLSNTTFLTKTSHSSQQLRIDNIKGSFNGSDIIKNVNGVPNEAEYFEKLYYTHESFSFEENLERLVESTNNIAPKGKRFELNEDNIQTIKNSVQRAVSFISSPAYIDLKSDLDSRIKCVQNEIAIASFIDNVNIRRRIIQYLITSDGGNLKEQIVDCLHNNKPIPTVKTDDRLGDYWKRYEHYLTATEIKTKVLFLDGNPKGYNIDKLLSFLSDEDSVFMIYIVGINDDKDIKVSLCSVFDRQLLDGTSIIFHWAGRNSRGVTQFLGQRLIDILNTPKSKIDEIQANQHIESMLNL